MLVSDIQLGLPDGELLSCVTQAMGRFRQFSAALSHHLARLLRAEFGQTFRCVYRSSLIPKG
jgi:hypothetical protein